MVFFIYSSLLSAIDSRRVWTGISDVDQEDKFVFQDGEVASIKAHGKTPSEDDDLFLTWGKKEPNNYDGGEDYVLIGKTSEFFDAKRKYEDIRAACEIPNPHCFEGTSLFALKNTTINVSN